MVKRIKPVTRIEKIEEEINRIIGEVFFHKKDALSFEEGWIPRVDIYEKGSEIVIETEVPGVFQKDVIILLHSNKIEIRGKKRENLSDKNIRYVRLEREYGTFRRVISLPGLVIPEKTQATLVNGVLIISMRKYAQEKAQKVQVRIQKTNDKFGEKNDRK